MKKWMAILAVSFLFALLVFPVRVSRAEASALPEENAEAAEEAVPAQPEEEEKPTETMAEEAAKPMDPVAVTSFVLASDPSTAAKPRRERPAVPASEYVKTFQFTENMTLKGIFQKSGFYFRISDYWDVKYAVAMIEYRVSPLITGDVPASLTFFINDVPIDSCLINYADGAVQVTYIRIPVEMLNEGYNEFAITGYVQLYDEEGCLDDFSGANWIIINKASAIEVGFDLIDTGNKLCYYPYPLLSPMDENGENLTVYVPDAPNEEELRTAFMLRANLTNSTGDEDRIAIKYLSAYNESGNALVIALRQRLPVSIQQRLPAAGKDLTGGCMVFEYGAGLSNTLVVTSDKAACLAEGAAMLMDENRVKQEKQSWAFVREGQMEQTVLNRSLSSLISNGETIKGITNNNGLDFVGPFHQEAIVYLPFSGGFVLGEGGKVTLIMRYSDNLDFDRSLVTVYWGDIPVASKKLEREKAAGDVFSFTMPSDVVGTHAASIKIAFELEIKELYCTKRSDEMPWAFVSGDSTLYLPTGSGSSWDLSLRPYPFLNLGEFNHLAVVVPKSMTDSELRLFGRIAALFGVDASPYGDFRVWFASDYPRETAAYHVITLGTYRDNDLLRAVNDKLHFSYDETGSQFLGNEQLVLGESYAQSVGILQIIDSPWQEGKAILAVCGVDEEAMDHINEFCSVQKNNWSLAGDTFLIDTDLETMSFRFLKERAEAQLSLIDRLEQHKDAVIMTLVSSGALLILLVGIVIVLFRFRKNRREETGK